MGQGGAGWGKAELCGQGGGMAGRVGRGGAGWEGGVVSLVVGWLAGWEAGGLVWAG